jgi:phage shock protein C
MPERLERSTINRVWSGVCGGIAQYFQIDPTIVRAFFVIATILTGGLFILVYIALIILMPLPGRRAPGEPAAPDGTTSETTDVATATPASQDVATATPASSEAADRRREAAGWFLVALGVIFLLANVGIFNFLQWRYVWPLALIALGVFIVVQRSRST